MLSYRRFSAGCESAGGSQDGITDNTQVNSSVLQRGFKIPLLQKSKQVVHKRVQTEQTCMSAAEISEHADKLKGALEKCKKAEQTAQREKTRAEEAETYAHVIKTEYEKRIALLMEECRNTLLMQNDTKNECNKETSQAWDQLLEEKTAREQAEEEARRIKNDNAALNETVGFLIESKNKLLTDLEKRKSYVEDLTEEISQATVNIIKLESANRTLKSDQNEPHAQNLTKQMDELEIKFVKQTALVKELQAKRELKNDQISGQNAEISGLKQERQKCEEKIDLYERKLESLTELHNKQIQNLSSDLKLTTRDKDAAIEQREIALRQCLALKQSKGFAVKQNNQLITVIKKLKNQAKCIKDDFKIVARLAKNLSAAIGSQNFMQRTVDNLDIIGQIKIMMDSFIQQNVSHLQLANEQLQQDLLKEVSFVDQARSEIESKREQLAKEMSDTKIRNEQLNLQCEDLLKKINVIKLENSALLEEKKLISDEKEEIMSKNSDLSCRLENLRFCCRKSRHHSGSSAEPDTTAENMDSSKLELGYQISDIPMESSGDGSEKDVIVKLQQMERNNDYLKRKLKSAELEFAVFLDDKDREICHLKQEYAKVKEK